MKITLYTVSNCQFSKQEKDYLLSHNLQYEEKNLETNKGFLTEMLAVSNNFAGTPVTKIEKDDGQIAVIKGFTKEEFDQTLGFTTVPAPVITETPTIIQSAPQEPIPPAPVFAPHADEVPKPAEIPVQTAEKPVEPVIKPEVIAPPIVLPTPIPVQTTPVNSQSITSSPNDAALNSLISNLEAKANTQEAPANPSVVPPAAPPTPTNLPNIPDFNNG